MQRVFLTASRDEWLGRLEADGIICAAVQSIEEVLDDPQAAQAWVDIPSRSGGESFRSVAGPVDFNHEVAAPRAVAALGEHTAEVLREAGLSAEEIGAVAAMREAQESNGPKL